MSRPSSTGRILLFFTIVFGSALILCACHRDSTPPETALKSTPPDTSSNTDSLDWINRANVKADFREQVENQQDTRFLSISGSSFSMMYGLDDSPDVRQLIDKYGERGLGSTTDPQLLEKAKDYVKQYNTLLLESIRNRKKN